MSFTDQSSLRFEVKRQFDSAPSASDMSPAVTTGAGSNGTEGSKEVSSATKVVKMKLELRTFPSNFSPNEEIHVHADDFGSRLRAGDLVEVYHPSREDGSMHLLLVVSRFLGN